MPIFRQAIVANGLRICSAWEFETVFLSLDIKLPKSVKNSKYIISPNATECFVRTERSELNVASSAKPINLLLCVGFILALNI